MAQRLGGMAGALGVGNQAIYLIRRSWAVHSERNRDLVEIGRRIINVVLLGVAEGRSHVGGGVVNRDVVERREPRQLGKQSERDTHHQELKWRWSLLASTARDRLVRVNVKLPKAALEMDIVDDSGNRASGCRALAVWLGAHLGAQPLDFPHLFVKVYSSARLCHGLSFQAVATRCDPQRAGHC